MQKTYCTKKVATTYSNVTPKLIYSAAESVQHENNFNATSKIYECTERNAKKTERIDTVQRIGSNRNIYNSMRTLVCKKMANVVKLSDWKNKPIIKIIRT